HFRSHRRVGEQGRRAQANAEDTVPDWRKFPGEELMEKIASPTSAGATASATKEVVTYGVADRIATITLNRPDRLNAWDDDMQTQFRSRMRQASEDPSVRVIVWTGAGRAFCAGAEISRLERNRGRMDGIDDLYPFDPNADIEYQTQFGYFPSIPKPIIA